MLIFAGLSLWSPSASAPTIPYESSLVLLNNNSLVAVIALETPRTGDWTKDEIIYLIREKYPEMANLLICMAKYESGFNRYAIGDSGLAHGLYQIHIDKHPVTEACAFNPECALDYTVKLILEGKGYKWTTYHNCL